MCRGFAYQGFGFRVGGDTLWTTIRGLILPNGGSSKYRDSRRLRGHESLTQYSRAESSQALLALLARRNQSQNTLSIHLDKTGNPPAGLPLPVVGVTVKEG